MPTLEINLLGELKIVYDGSLITSTFPSKSQALLAYLAATRESHSRHALAGLFWGDRTEQKAKNSLRVAINGLRKQIPDHLEITRQTLGLKLNNTLYVDLNQLESVVEPMAPDNSPVLNTIPRLYRGEFLSGLILDETPEFDEWLESQRSVWRQIALRGLSRLTEQHLADEAFDEALKILARHLEIDPCAEEAYQQAMVAYSRKGDLPSALAQYTRCKQALQEHLGVEPGPETTALFQKLDGIQDKLDLPTHHSVDVTQASDDMGEHASASYSLLIGRERELQQLTTMLRDPFCRLITIAGFGGIGKTQLALALLEEIIQADTVLFLHGVPFVSLVGIESATLIPMTIADALDAPLSGKRDPLDDLIDMLGQKEMLIILDNFEHLIDSGTDVVNCILNECPQVKLLITCREWLNIAAEWRLGLEGLSYPTENEQPNAKPRKNSVARLQDMNRLKGYSAIQFFTVEASRVRPDFELKQSDAESLVRLCQLVGGIPLALKLAATWTNSMSVEAIAIAVDKDLEMLSSSLQHMPTRQRSMKVVFDSSWNQLLPHEQTLFQALSVFRGGFTVDAAASLLDAEETPVADPWSSSEENVSFDGRWSLTLETLDALANRGLVQYDEGRDRYHLHELLRQLASEKLHEDEELAQIVQQRHSIYFCQQLARLDSLRKGAEQVSAFRACNAEQENIWAAWHTAIGNQQVDMIAISVDSLGAFLEWRSGFSDAAVLFESTAEMLESVLRSNPTASDITTSISVYSWLANFCRLTGRIEQAKSTLVRASQLFAHDLLQLSIDQADRETSRALRSAKAFWALQSGHLDIDVNNRRAQEKYSESVELYQALGLEWELAVALEALSMVSQSVGDLATASKLIQQSLTIRRRIGDLRGTAAALSILSTVTRFQGNVDRAIQLAKESNELYQSIGDRSSVAEGLQNLGMTLNYVGEYEEALELIEASILIYRDLNNSVGLAKAHANAGHVAGCLGQFDRGGYHAKETIALGETLNELRWVANGYTLLGWHAIVHGNYKVARQHAEESLSLAKSAGGHAEEDIARSVLAYAFDGLRMQEDAQQLFFELLQIALREKDFLPLVTAVPKIGLMILVEMSGPDHGLQEHDVRLWQKRGVTAYQIMRRWPVVATSKLMEVPITIPLTKEMEQLSPALLKEVEDIAATRDIWDILSELVEHLPSIWKASS